MKRGGLMLLLSALALSALQIGFLSWTIFSRAAVLRDGREVLLKVEPIDPRDWLRGDYVRLNYEARTVPASLVENRGTSETTRDGDVHVRLGRDDDGYWRVRSASLGMPLSAPAGPDEVDILGKAASGWSLPPDGSLTVDYGIDRYYVPEGEGRANEADMRERPFGILAAVGPDGRAQIKALMDGQTPLYEEPLY
jgi:uncharacterized membrane-anchored protein